MSSTLVVLASSLMLAAAQLRLPAHQIASLPNLHPLQIPTSSQALMTQSALSILNDDTGIPLSPGILGSAPVFVSETAQSVLDQESRIVGYNLPSVQSQQSQYYIPTFARQTNHARRVPSLNPNVIPVRATVSLKSLLNTQNPTREQRGSQTRNVYNQPINSQQIYYDIPPNHPIPPPTSSTSSSSQARQVPDTTDDEVVFMRPPHPSATHDFFRHENDNADTRSHHQHHLHHDDPSPLRPSSTAQNEEKSSNTRKPENKRKKSSKHRQSKSSRKNRESDSVTDSSETSFFTALPPPPYETNNLHNNDGQGRVHKHIFVHSAPEAYPESPRVKVIRPPPQDKHIQIIFVKSPTEAPPTETIVELPPAEQPKTLVYILSKKPDEKGGQVTIKNSPVSSKPHPPEIYFIRYGDRRDTQGYPVPDLQSLDNNYGTNSFNPQLSSFPRQKRNKDYGVDVYAPLMSYSVTGQINELSQEEASLRKGNLDAFF